MNNEFCPSAKRSKRYINELQVQRADMQTKLYQYEIQEGKLNDEAAANKEQIIKLPSLLESRNDCCGDQLEQDCSEAQEEPRNSELEIKRLKEQLQQRDSEILNLKQENQFLCDKVVQLQKAEAQVPLSRKVAVTQWVRSLEERDKELQQTDEELRERDEELQQRYEELWQRDEELQQRDEELQQRDEELREEKNTFNEEKNKFNEEKNTFKEEKNTFKEENNKFNKENNTFKEQKNKFKEEKKKFKEEKKKFKEEKNTFKEEKNTFNEEKNKFKQLEEGKKGLHGQYQECQNVSQALKELTKLQKDIQEKKIDRAELLEIQEGKMSQVEVMNLRLKELIIQNESNEIIKLREQKMKIERKLLHANLRELEKQNKKLIEEAKKEQKIQEKEAKEEQKRREKEAKKAKTQEQNANRPRGIWSWFCRSVHPEV